MSADLAVKLRSCLKVCLKRTNALIDLLQDGSPEKIADLARLRGASIHNFRAMDANARSIGYDCYSDPETREIVDELRQRDRELFGRLEKFRAEIGDQLTKIESGKRSIARYKSRSGERKNLVQSV